jgi:hypothetical protein
MHSDSPFPLCILLRQNENSLTVHSRGPRYVPLRLFHQYIHCSDGRQIFRDIFCRCRELCSVAGRCFLVRTNITSFKELFVLQVFPPRRLGNNLSGQYKRGVGMALHIGIGNFSAAIASNIYRTRDGPRYVLGRESSRCMSA